WVSTSIASYLPSVARIARPSAGPRWTSQPLSAVRAPRMAQATSAAGSTQATQPDAPEWPNEFGLASAGAQWGDFASRSSGPTPHGLWRQTRGGMNPPASAPVWLRVASARRDGERNPAGCPRNARARRSAPSTVVSSPPHGSASERQNGVL